MYGADDWHSKMTVPSGLTGNKGYELLESVIGQMSDGKWENTPGYNRYWAHCEIDKETNDIIVDKGYGSGFRDMDEKKVREFFCRRIKAVLQDFCNEINNPFSTAVTEWGWSADKCEYLGYDEVLSVDEIKKMVKQIKALNKV